MLWLKMAMDYLALSLNVGMIHLFSQALFSLGIYSSGLAFSGYSTVLENLGFRLIPIWVFIALCGLVFP